MCLLFLSDQPPNSNQARLRSSRTLLPAQLYGLGLFAETISYIGLKEFAPAIPTTPIPYGGRRRQKDPWAICVCLWLLAELIPDRGLALKPTGLAFDFYGTEESHTISLGVPCCGAVEICDPRPWGRYHGLANNAPRASLVTTDQWHSVGGAWGAVALGTLLEVCYGMPLLSFCTLDKGWEGAQDRGKTS